jgi:hypothetical protein
MTNFTVPASLEPAFRVWIEKNAAEGQDMDETILYAIQVAMVKYLGREFGTNETLEFMDGGSEPEKKEW